MIPGSYDDWVTNYPKAILLGCRDGSTVGVRVFHSPHPRSKGPTGVSLRHLINAVISLGTAV